MVWALGGARGSAAVSSSALARPYRSTNLGIA